MRKATKKATTRKPKKKVAVRPGVRAWTAAEVAKLKKMYKTEPATKIAKALKRTLSSVKAKIRTLGIKKPATKKVVKKKPIRKVAKKRVVKKGAKKKVAKKPARKTIKKAAKKKVAKKPAKKKPIKKTARKKRRR